MNNEDIPAKCSFLGPQIVQQLQSSSHRYYTLWYNFYGEATYAYIPIIAVPSKLVDICKKSQCKINY